MKNKLIWIILVGLVFIAGAIIVANYDGSGQEVNTFVGGLESRKQIASQVMPEGFNDVYIGMTRGELIKLRDVKPFMPHEDGRAPSIWMDKTFNSPFYSGVIYFFSESESENELVAVVYTIERDEKSIDDILPLLVQGSINKWGSNYDLKVGVIRISKGSYNSPVMIWNKDSTVIAVTFTPRGYMVERGGATIAVRIMSNKMNVSKFLNILDQPEQSLIEEYSYDIKKALEVNVINEGDLFE